MARMIVIASLLIVGVGWSQADDDYKFEHGFYISNKGESYGDGHEDGYKKEEGYGYSKVKEEKHGDHEDHEYSFGHEVNQESYESSEPEIKEEAAPEPVKFTIEDALSPKVTEETEEEDESDYSDDQHDDNEEQFEVPESPKHEEVMTHNHVPHVPKFTYDSKMPQVKRVPAYKVPIPVYLSLKLPSNIREQYYG